MGGGGGGGAGQIGMLVDRSQADCSKGLDGAAMCRRDGRLMWFMEYRWHGERGHALR